MTSPAEVASALELLRDGEMTIVGRLVDASNATLFCEITDGERAAHCVYKPVRGERPLWDFPDGTLAGREVSAYLISAATGWNIVPPTVMRDGELGRGMVQLWIDVDETVDLVAMIRRGTEAMRRIAVFDVVVNNADRKGGHLLPDPFGHLYGVDHGISFHVEDKLRTLLWHWSGEPLPQADLEILRRLRRDLDGDLGRELKTHIRSAEVGRTRGRIDALLQSGTMPEPPEWRHAVPWPPM